MKKQILTVIMVLSMMFVTLSCEKEPLIQEQNAIESVEKVIIPGSTLVGTFDGLELYELDDATLAEIKSSLKNVPPYWPINSTTHFPDLGSTRVPDWLTRTGSNTSIGGSAYTNAPGSTGGCITTSIYSGGEHRLLADIAGPGSGTRVSTWVKFSSLASGTTYYYAHLVNLTEGEYNPMTVDHDVITSTNWTYCDWDVGTRWVESVEAYSDWDQYGDNYALWFGTITPSPLPTYLYYDYWTLYGWDAPSATPTITGPSTAYVSAANLNAYTATFSVPSGHYAYQWTVNGGAIVGSSTSNSVTIDFDTYGGKQVFCKIKEEWHNAWSSQAYKSHTVYPQY